MLSRGNANVNVTSSSTIKLFEFPGAPPGTVTSTFVTFNVPTTRPPPFASQPRPVGISPGAAGTVDTSDFRVRSVSWLKDKLWFGVNAACPRVGGFSGQACLRLFEIDTARTSLIQDFYYGVSNMDAYYPAIGIDPVGNIELIYA